METILEQQRRYHEERERLQDAMVKEMMHVKKTVCGGSNLDKMCTDGYWMFRPLAVSPPAWTFRLLDGSPPGPFAPGTIRPLTTYTRVTEPFYMQNEMNAQLCP